MQLAPQGPSIEYPASGAYIWDHCHPLPCLSDALDVLGKNREASQLKNSANTPTRPTPSGTVKSIVPKQWRLRPRAEICSIVWTELMWKLFMVVYTKSFSWNSFYYQDSFLVHCFEEGTRSGDVFWAAVLLEVGQVSCIVGAAGHIEDEVKRSSFVELWSKVRLGVIL